MGAPQGAPATADLCPSVDGLLQVGLDGLELLWARHRPDVMGVVPVDPLPKGEVLSITRRTKSS